MSHFSFMRYVKPLAMSCVLLLLSACAATEKKTESIEDRANARWVALFDNDIEGAYGYLAPGYRSSVSLQQYQRALMSQPVKWTSAKYVDSKCEATACDVKLSVGFTVYGALPGVKSFSGKQYVHESWVLVDGKWYMVPPR